MLSTLTRRGHYPHRITIQRPAVTTDEFGAPVSESWTDVATVWAVVESVSGLEKWRGVQVTPETSHMVEIRYRAGLTTDCRLVFQGTRVFNIMSIRDPDERKVQLLINCTERT